jgi:hypothetical protein
VSDLRQLAEKATPGPWRVTRETVGHEAANILYGSPEMRLATVIAGPTALDDAEFIAACSPERVLAMLDVIEAAQARLALVIKRWDEGYDYVPEFFLGRDLMQALARYDALEEA